MVNPNQIRSIGLAGEPTLAAKGFNASSSTNSARNAGMWNFGKACGSNPERN
jgi:hypothetical protein